MAVKKRGLGRGLDALLGPGGGASNEVGEGDELQDLPLNKLGPGPHQPRKNFDQAALQSLADSIKAQGVVQPIVCRPAAGGKFDVFYSCECPSRIEPKWFPKHQVSIKNMFHGDLEISSEFSSIL